MSTYYEYRMQGPPARQSVNAVGPSSTTTHLLYDPRRAFGDASMAVDPSVELSNYGAAFNNSGPLNSLDYIPDPSENLKAYRSDDHLARASVGARYYHAHSSINASDYASPWPVTDLSLHAHNGGNENMKLLAQSQNRMFAPSINSHGHYPPSSVVLESAYHTPTYSAQSRFSAQSPISASQFPKTIPHLDAPARTEVQNFVNMNDATIRTEDLPEDSPFAVVQTNQNEETFNGYSYPKGHRWPQTFRITEIKQIGPKKQTLACFFCRSRKIACTTRPVDGTENGPCEQCERRGLDCKYPTESKRGQHTRIRSLNSRAA